MTEDYQYHVYAKAKNKTLIPYKYECSIAKLYCIKFTYYNNTKLYNILLWQNTKNIEKFFVVNSYNITTLPS